MENPAHAERARRIVDDFLKLPTGGPPQVCPACREDSPASFELCWSCGAVL